MNKNLLRRRQLLSYFGIGTMLASAEPILDIALRRTHGSTSSSINSTAVAAGEAETKALPEFQGINQWLNSAPLTTQNLKDQVVLVHFWTFGCINCQRTLHYVVRWHRQFVAQGLKVIGVHTPEFAFERNVNNVKRALPLGSTATEIAIAQHGFAKSGGCDGSGWCDLQQSSSASPEGGATQTLSQFSSVGMSKCNFG